MGLDVTVYVCTYGSTHWMKLATERAVPSAIAAGAPRVTHVHRETLHESRNAALTYAQTEYVCFLDADDELEPCYFEAMSTGTADLRAPSVRYVREGCTEPAADPYVPKVAGHTHDCTAECLPYGNWLVIGTVARTDIVRKVGGFRDFTWSEDWDLWVRCYLAGALVEAIPDAVYRAYVREESRNRLPQRAARVEAHNAIARANGLPVVA